MDFLALYITAKLTHSAIRPLPMAAAAVIGAVWALIVTLLEPYITAPGWQIFILVADMICAGVMTAVSSRQKSVSLKKTVAFLAVSIGLGGIMTALYSFIGRMTTQHGSVQSSADSTASPLVFIVSALAAGAVSLAYGRFRAKSSSRIKVSAVLSAFGAECSLALLSDSGNLLCEPYTGKPVVIICAKSLDGILPKLLLDMSASPESLTELPYEMSRKVRLISARGVTGSGMLLCFIPDRLCVDGIELEAAAAIDVNSTDYDGCDGIIPQTLLNM